MATALNRHGGERAVVIWQDTPQQGARVASPAPAHARLGSPFSAPAPAHAPLGSPFSAPVPSRTGSSGRRRSRAHGGRTGVAPAACVNCGRDGESVCGRLAIARLGVI